MEGRLAVAAGIAFGWLFSLTFHEWSHSIVAYKGGDTGIAERGYLSWNPLRYMNPVMSIVFPLALLFLGGIALPGGATYVDRSSLRSKGWQSAVSLAGPAANLVLAAVLAAWYRAVAGDARPAGVSAGAIVLGSLVYLQVMAFLLNLLPIPPLDGWGALKPFLPDDLREMGDQFGFLGFVLVFVLLSGGGPVAGAFYRALFWLCLQVGGVPFETYVAGVSTIRIWR